MYTLIHLELALGMADRWQSFINQCLDKLLTIKRGVRWEGMGVLGEAGKILALFHDTFELADIFFSGLEAMTELLVAALKALILQAELDQVFLNLVELPLEAASPALCLGQRLPQ